MKGPKLDTLIRCRASRMATPKLDWQGVCICRLPWKPHNLLKLQGFLASCAIRAARPLYMGMDQRCQKHVTLTKIHSKWRWIKSSVQELMYEYISQIQLLGVPKPWMLTVDDVDPYSLCWSIGALSSPPNRSKFSTETAWCSSVGESAKLYGSRSRRWRHRCSLLQVL